MIVIFDTESTTFQKGNPFANRNKLMCIGTLGNNEYRYFSIDHTLEPYGDSLGQVRHLLERAQLLVGFNLKFDMHWIQRYIPDIKWPQNVWDCQLAEFILSNQMTQYPSLATSLSAYGLAPKLDVVKTEYWDKGRDTTEVPSELLSDYNEGDCRGTYSLYQKQKEILKGKQLTLFQLHCDDLLMLQEMEYNGLRYDTVRSREMAQDLGQEMGLVVSELNGLIQAPFTINWGSPKQLSAILYGGSIDYPIRETTTRTLKDGTIKSRERWGTATHNFEQLIAPLSGSENSFGWSTDEPTLTSLHAKGQAKRIIELILKVSELEKLKGTYYEGLPNLIQEMDWPADTLHGTINQCVAVTGRTSSSRPNLQNFDGRLKPLFYSRYAN